MTTHSEDLVSLEELRSVLNTYAGPDNPRERPARHGLRRLRPVLVVAVAVAALAGTGAAIADGLGAFGGIGAANHPQTGADMIDPATATYLDGKYCSGSINPKTGVVPKREGCRGVGVIGLQLDLARHLGQLPDGQNVYLIPRHGDNDNLCTVVGPPHPEIECNSVLSQSHPTTIYTYDLGNNDPTTRWVTFGVALDGVTSVSFQYSTQATPAEGGGPVGPRVAVPVHDNLWMYPSNNEVPPTVLQPVTVHFADGTTVTEPATGKNCAAC
jgi:hypothetical protein